MNSTDNFILIDYKKLAEKLAKEQFHREVEPTYKFHEIWEQVDESKHWYMRLEFQSILETMEQEWQELLQEYDITNSIEL